MSYQSVLKYGLQWVVAFSLGVLTVVSNATEQGRDIKDVKADKPVATRLAVIYKPLQLDAPRVRVDGRLRDADNEAAILQVLTPEHTGFTTQEHPTLYWYARTPVAVSFELTQTDEGKTNTLLKTGSDGKKVAGIQQLDLGKHNISLLPDVVYQWSVKLAIDENSQSKSVLASGGIERIEPGEGLISRIKKSHGIGLVNVYASEGIWYDALETISSMIGESPEDEGLVAIRASLLEQVGLHAAAGN